MARNGEISLTDAKRILRKYWWILPLSTLLLGALGFVATLVLPKKYTSSTSVLVEQPVVSAEYVRPVVTDDLNLRLASMKGQVLSGPRLQPIIEKLNLFPEQRGKVPMDNLVGQLSSAVGVELLQPMPGAGGRPGIPCKCDFRQTANGTADLLRNHLDVYGTERSEADGAVTKNDPIHGQRTPNGERESGPAR